MMDDCGRLSVRPAGVYLSVCLFFVCMCMCILIEEEEVVQTYCNATEIWVLVAIADCALENYIIILEKCERRDRKSTRLNSSHPPESRMPSSA